MSRVDEVLAGLREERDRLRAELARVEEAIASLDGSSRAYTMMSVYEAATDFLTKAGEPKTSREIADALRAGGFKTTSNRFAGSVRVMLRRDTARLWGIKCTSDGKRWFVHVQRNRTSRRSKATRAIPETTSRV